VDKETFFADSYIAFTYEFDWDGLWHGSHKSHMESIRVFSQIADTKCLNWIRYKFCPIHIPIILPSRAGQVKKDPICLRRSCTTRSGEGGIIGGDAFIR